MSKKKYTKEEKRMFKKKNKNLSLFSSVVVGMFIVSTVYFIYNLLKLTGVEDLLRYILIGVLGIFTLYIIKKNFSLRIQPKKYKIILFSLILLLLGFGMVYTSRLISRGISTIDNLNKNEVTYSTALITLKSNKEVTKDTVSTKKIGIISDTDDTEGYVLAQTIIKKLGITDSNLVKYDEYITMLNDLYSNDVDAIFVSGGYVEKYSGLSSFENIKDDVKVISKYKKTMKKRVTNSTKVSKKSVTEPFTMLLLGVDSPEENISDAVALGDTIMVVTFNPNTLNATLFSIPRDTYVPITCYGNALSKITHAASGGDSCMIETVQNFIDIDIDYYAKINFRGLMNLVDALGGIDVDVPYSFCETDENRTFYNAVFVKKGMQHLDGRAALGLARNRKYYPTCGEEYNEGDRSDFVRGQNQQLVLKAILKRAKEIRSVDQFYNVLDTISKSMDTNLSREQILGFYNIFKKVLLSTDSLTEGNDVISMQRTFLRGGGGIIMDHVAGTGLYEFVPSQEGLNAIKKVMKINLGLEEEEYDKSFSFSIDTPYEAEIIGEDLWGGVKSYPRYTEEETPTESKKDCSGKANSEPSADNTICVCKSGYEEKAGKCVKKEKLECEAPLELSGDGNQCLCPTWKDGYEGDEDNCVKKEQTPTPVPDDPTPTEPDDPTPTEPDVSNED